MEEQQRGEGVQQGKEKSVESKVENKMEKKKYKEKLNPEQLRSMLQQWIEAIDNQQDLEVKIRGEDCLIPQSALQSGRIEAEFELKKGEYEFEIELKWKADSADVSQQVQ
jgi:hypothetical protein